MHEESNENTEMLEKVNNITTSEDHPKPHLFYTKEEAECFYFSKCSIH